jgi:hypothetical protein
MTELAKLGREAAAAKLVGMNDSGLPGLIVDAAQQYGGNEQSKGE